jgi:sortase (surface protein transpeptidase)
MPLGDPRSFDKSFRAKYSPRPTQYINRSSSRSINDMVAPKEPTLVQPEQMAPVQVPDPVSIPKSAETIKPQTPEVISQDVPKVEEPQTEAEVVEAILAEQPEFSPETEEILNQQFVAPIYLNNYNNEYEDKTYSRFSLKMNRITKRFAVSAALVLTGLIVGVSLIFIGSRGKNIANAQSDNNSVTQNGFTLSTTVNPIGSPPYSSTTQPTNSELQKYSVAANEPKFLIIPKLNIDSMITPVSLKDSNYLVAPSNIFNVGWWQQSSVPGETGAVVLDGFTTNGTIGGALQAIAKLKVGDTFTIQTGNNTKVNYSIAQISAFGKNNLSMEQAITPYNLSKPSLNIITCSGQYSTCPSSIYDSVVYAEQQ